MKEKVMEFRSSDVMAYVLYKAKEDEHPLNKTQAQKVLYCCYGAVLAKFNERLTDEHPKAWPYGPLFPRAISDINKQRLTVGMAQEIEKQWSPELKELIDQTICTFSVYTATQLSNWSHFPGSPWSKADPLASLDDREISLYFAQYLPVIEKRGEECTRSR